jgi:hypothetical protein
MLESSEDRLFPTSFIVIINAWDVEALTKHFNGGVAQLCLDFEHKDLNFENTC